MDATQHDSAYSWLRLGLSLLLSIVGGTPGPVVEAVEEDELPNPAPIALRRERIERLLGVAIDDAEVERILTLDEEEVDEMTLEAPHAGE